MGSSPTAIKETKLKADQIWHYSPQMLHKFHKNPTHCKKLTPARSIPDFFSERGFLRITDLGCLCIEYLRKSEENASFLPIKRLSILQFLKSAFFNLSGRYLIILSLTKMELLQQI